MIRRQLLCFLVGLTACTLLAGCGQPRFRSVEPPRHGALFGAYVDPPEYLESQRIAAFEKFEDQLDRPLAIYHNFHKWDVPFPTESDDYFAQRGTTLLLSWAGTDTRAIAAGHYDGLIRERAGNLERLGRPVLLRWRWEMNRPNLREEIHSGGDYVAAWRRIHTIFADVGVRNVEWVWCPLVSSRADPAYGDYYPGDTYVDWLCVDGYPESPEQSLQQILTPYIIWAKAIEKPILIGEFGQRAGSIGRDIWLEEAREFVERSPQIKAVSYFDNARGVSGDYSVRGDPQSLSAMRAWATDPYFNPR